MVEDPTLYVKEKDFAYQYDPNATTHLMCAHNNYTKCRKTQKIDFV